jgi:ribonuclease HI
MDGSNFSSPSSPFSRPFVSLYTDGSSLGNPGAGGWCAILEWNGGGKILKGGEPLTTNNRMELRGVLEGLKEIQKLIKEGIISPSTPIYLYSDSQYVIKGIGEWLPNWVKRGFKNVKNPDLWREYLRLSHRLNIYPHWVKGHDGNPKNEMCDFYARQEASRFQQKMGSR